MRENGLEKVEVKIGLKNLIIERGRTVELESLPEYSIALDGYVQGPVVDTEKQRYSFDHHGNCVRMLTSATCRQAMDALLLGLDPSKFTAFVNDIDGDTVLAVWLLQNPDKVNDPVVRRLVESVGGIDAHGPAYTSLDPELAEMFYQGVMRPESDLRREKKYAQADLNELLQKCLNNIDMLLENKLEWSARTQKERSYEILYQGTGWVMVKSDDPVFDLLYKQGINRAIALQDLPDGSTAYTVAKKSEIVDGFPIGEIFKALNNIETGWGGGSTVGGAPRNTDGSRSRLAPEQVFEVVERTVKDYITKHER